MSGNMTAANIWPYYSKQNVQAAARQPTNELGKDQFLQILIMQLRNQDPMQPLQDQNFIAQMAQFSALEQTVNMSKELASLRQSAGLVSGLIGKSVEWLDETGGKMERRSGIVEAIVRRDGIQYAKVGQYEVKIDELVTISERSESGENSSAPEGAVLDNE